MQAKDKLFTLPIFAEIVAERAPKDVTTFFDKLKRRTRIRTILSYYGSPLVVLIKSVHPTDYNHPSWQVLKDMFVNLREHFQIGNDNARMQISAMHDTIIDVVLYISHVDRVYNKNGELVDTKIECRTICDFEVRRRKLIATGYELFDSKIIDGIQVPVPSNILDNIKKGRVVPEAVMNALLSMKEDDRQCSICFESISDKNVLHVTECIHLYHVECIDEWKKKNRWCPICKAPIQ